MTSMGERTRDTMADPSNNNWSYITVLLHIRSSFWSSLLSDILQIYIYLFITRYSCSFFPFMMVAFANLIIICIPCLLTPFWRMWEGEWAMGHGHWKNQSSFMRTKDMLELNLSENFWSSGYDFEVAPYHYQLPRLGPGYPFPVHCRKLFHASLLEGIWNGCAAEMIRRLSFPSPNNRR